MSSLFEWFKASDSKTKDWCTAVLWSADISISWRGGSTKQRKAVAIRTPFYFHHVASRATGLPVGPELAVCCFSLGIKLSTSVFPATLCNHRIFKSGFQYRFCYPGLVLMSESSSRGCYRVG